LPVARAPVIAACAPHLWRRRRGALRERNGLRQSFGRGARHGRMATLASAPSASAWYAARIAAFALAVDISSFIFACSLARGTLVLGNIEIASSVVSLPGEADEESTHAAIERASCLSIATLRYQRCVSNPNAGVTAFSLLSASVFSLCAFAVRLKLARDSEMRMLSAIGLALQVRGWRFSERE